MLQTIRDKSQGIIALVIVILLCITFALWGIHNYFYGSSANQPVAKVNGQVITAQQFQLSFDRFRQQQLQNNPDLFSSEDSIQQTKKMLLKSMVMSDLLTQSAVKNGFSIGPDLLELELANMPIFQEDGKFSKLRFQEVLSSLMFSQEEFFDSLRNTMLLAQVRLGFSITSVAMPYQIDKALMLINQKRSFNVILVPAKQFLAQTKVSDADIQNYYQAHQQEFAVPAKVSLSYLSLSLNDLMAKIHPSAQDLQTYYQNNINRYTTPKKWKLAHILIAVPSDAGPDEIKVAQDKANALVEKLRSGASFDNMAQQNSDDLITAKKGGVLPDVNLLSLDSTWQTQIVSLQSSGQLSTPFRTSQGFEIIKLLGVTPAVIQPFNAVKARVEQDYVKETAEKQFADLSDQLSNLTFQHPDSLQPAANQLNLPVESTELFTQNDGGQSALTKNPKVIAAAFSNEVFAQGNNSDPVQISPSQVVVVRVKEKVPASVLSLEQVKDQIKTSLQHEQASALAKATADKLLTGLQSGQMLSKLAATNKLEVSSYNDFNRNTSGKVNSTILAHVFSMGKPTGQNISADSISLASGDAALIQLTAVTDSALQQYAREKAVYGMGMSRSLGLLDYALYTKSLEKSGNIRYYHKNLLSDN